MLGPMAPFTICTILNNRISLSLHILFHKADFKFWKCGRKLLLSFPTYLENRETHVSALPPRYSVYTLRSLSLEFQALPFSLVVWGFQKFQNDAL